MSKALIVLMVGIIGVAAISVGLGKITLHVFTQIVLMVGIIGVAALPTHRLKILIVSMVGIIGLSAISVGLGKITLLVFTQIVLMVGVIGVVALRQWGGNQTDKKLTAEEEKRSQNAQLKHSGNKGLLIVPDSVLHEPWECDSCGYNNRPTDTDCVGCAKRRDFTSLIKRLEDGRE